MFQDIPDLILVTVVERVLGRQSISRLGEEELRRLVEEGGGRYIYWRILGENEGPKDDSAEPKGRILMSFCVTAASSDTEGEVAFSDTEKEKIEALTAALENNGYCCSVSQVYSHHFDGQKAINVSTCVFWVEDPGEGYGWGV